MTTTTAQARQIQGQISNRAPSMTQQGALITAPTAAPTLLTDGVSLLDATSRSAVKAVLAIKLVDATSVDIVVWGLLGGVGWVALEGGARAAITSSWSQIFASGALTRAYLQITATDGTVEAYVGPCGVNA